MLKVYRSFKEVPYYKNSIITLGTFDGVHLGHQKILNKLLTVAKNEHLRPLIISFYPHPQIVLNRKANPVKLLTSIEERVNVFDKFGLENLLIAPFTKEFAQTPPEVFIKDFLVDQIGFKKILIGYDHMFGKDRSGSIEQINKLSKENNYEVEQMDALSASEDVISSTRIRNLIATNKIEEANKLLGWKYYLQGQVKVGDRRGRTIGYPTANVYSKEEHKLLPGRGVYLVRLEVSDKWHWGVANVGRRPTFKESDPDILEINIFDFNEDIYRKDVKVEFYSFIRTEKKFESKEELIEQIKKDSEKAKNLIESFAV